MLISHLIKKSVIKCHIGLYHIEKYIVNHLNLKDDIDETTFFNNQVILYEWLEARHLGFENVDIEDNKFDFFFENKIPIKKFTVLKRYVDHIVSPGIGGIDIILSHLVLYIIKHGCLNIIKHLEIINIFANDFNIGACNKETCPHLLLETPIKLCKKLDIDVYKNTSFYKTLLESAIKFISELEYKKLNISEAEYIKNIAISLEKMQKLVSEKKR
ncbi:hypothetical protein CDIK_2283 [Cucumispora dikerogammari]|nr:hypothetical protein CDIK_2283 [Cucumispora dikerogammari]